MVAGKRFFATGLAKKDPDPDFKLRFSKPRDFQL
jgi:hypothetical protein